MEGHERMTIDPSEAARPEGGRRDEAAGGERESAELGRRAETLGDELRSFEKDAGEADRMLEKMKDPAKREEFKSALGALRGRASGAGNALRGVVAGLALFAGGVGVGKGMNDERRESAVVDLARQAGAADAENRMLRAEIARKDEAAGATREAAAAKSSKADRATDVLVGENKELRAQLAEMAKELARLRAERDEANARVIAEKEKGLVTQDALFKQQAVTGNLGQLYQKMKDLIDGSGDPKLKEDADRFLAAYE
ncbi:MAG TPA: hypothetical protein VLC10_02055 [Patescibacteria group bacterium]|nr:hypothetical protein [Patescibacteria group bacterium]